MKSVLKLFLATTLVHASLSIGGAQTERPQSFRDGMFSAGQASRGERLYTQHCTLCHGDNLLGIEMAPPLAGPNFTRVWGSVPLVSFAGRIKTTMPPQAANTLSSAETVDIVSYILAANGLKAGPSDMSLALSDAPDPSATLSQVDEEASQWTTYGRNLASHRYSPLDQINKDNFANLQIAWRLSTNNLGPYPERLFSATPLMVNGVLYTTAGASRSVVALDPGTGQMLWMYHLDEGVRGRFAPRRGSGRGVSYWESPDGGDKRILFVTPGYQLIALDAATGRPVESFGRRGIAGFDAAILRAALTLRVRVSDWPAPARGDVIFFSGAILAEWLGLAVVLPDELRTVTDVRHADPARLTWRLDTEAAA